MLPDTVEIPLRKLGDISKEGKRVEGWERGERDVLIKTLKQLIVHTHESNTGSPEKHKSINDCVLPRMNKNMQGTVSTKRVTRLESTSLFPKLSS